MVSASPAVGESISSEALLEDLRTNCYDVYQPQFVAASAAIPGITTEQIDWTELGDSIPEEMRSQLGIDSEALAGLQEMMAEATNFMAPYTKEAYLGAAQVKVDLAQCYVDHGAINAQPLLQDAQDQYTAIENYDFEAAYNNEAPGTSAVTVLAGETKQLRIRTFCLDGGRGVPATGEEYYLAGSVYDLQGEGLCNLLRSATASSAMTTTQVDIWTNYNTALKPSSDLDPNTSTMSRSDQALLLVTENALGNLGTVIQAGPEKTILNAVNAVPNMVGLGLAIGGGLLLLGSIVCGAAHWLPRPVWIIGLVAGVGLAAVGITTVVAKTAGATEQAIPSLYDAASSGQVTVAARSNGSFTSLDIAITNTSTANLTLDTSCLTFIPKTINFSNSDFNEGDFDYDYDRYDDSGEEVSHASQRLGSGEIIDDNPPPFPWWPPLPEPEDTLDLEELQKKTREALDEATKKLKENPTEDNLEEVMRQRARCEALGCNEGTDADDKNWEEVQKAWQQGVDKAVENYQKDPSDYNREELERAVELGQFVGADTDAAVEILISNPAPELVG